MNIKYLLLLVVLLVFSLSACGTLDLNGSLVSENELAVTQQAQNVNNLEQVPTIATQEQMPLPTLVPSPSAVAEIQTVSTQVPTEMPTLVPTMVPTPETQVIPTSEFEQMVQEAIVTQNYEWMGQLMDDPFSIALWRSEGYSVTPVEALADLREIYLLPGQVIDFTDPPPDLSAVLGPDRDILAVWDPAANAVSAVFSTGWGPDGQTEAFLIISVLEDGIVQWDGIIFAGGGFDGQ